MRVSKETLHYNGLDCIATLQCADAFFPEVDRYGFRSPYDLTLALYPPLMYMQGRGIKVNRTKLEETSRTIARKLGELQEEINKRCGRSLNPLSPKDCSKYFYVEKEISPYYKRGADGKSTITCDDKALTR